MLQPSPVRGYTKSRHNLKLIILVSVLLTDDPYLKPVRVFKIFFLIFTNILYFLCIKGDSTEDYIESTREVCSEVIECKPIKGIEMRRQDDGHRESHFLKFQTTRPWIHLWPD